MAYLPIRSRVLHHISQVPKANVYTIMEALQSEYGKERQFIKSNFENHLQNLHANGLIDEKNYYLHHNQELVIDYVINEEGLQTIKKYLPKEYRKKL